MSIISRSVNDLHGHLAGDKALRAIAHTFRIFLREYDLAGRFGGEEFALLLPQTSAADARQIAERVRLHIAETPISVSDDPGAEPVQVTVSMGVAALGTAWERTTGSQLTDLLAGADRALYQAKNAGRNHVVMVTDQGRPIGVAARRGLRSRQAVPLTRTAVPACRRAPSASPPGLARRVAQAEPGRLIRLRESARRIPRAWPARRGFQTGLSSTSTRRRCGGSRACRIPGRPSP